VLLLLLLSDPIAEAAHPPRGRARGRVLPSSAAPSAAGPRGRVPRGLWRRHPLLPLLRAVGRERRRHRPRIWRRHRRGGAVDGGCSSSSGPRGPPLRRFDADGRGGRLPRPRPSSRSAAAGLPGDGRVRRSAGARCRGGGNPRLRCAGAAGDWGRPEQRSRKRQRDLRDRGTGALLLPERSLYGRDKRSQHTSKTAVGVAAGGDFKGSRFRRDCRAPRRGKAHHWDGYKAKMCP